MIMGVEPTGLGRDNERGPERLPVAPGRLKIRTCGQKSATTPTFDLPIPSTHSVEADFDVSVRQ